MTENNTALIVSLSIGLAVVFSLLLIPAFSADTIILNTGSSGNATGETTECFNVGNGIFIIKNSTMGNCYVKSLVGSSDILITNTSNTITIDFNGTFADATICANTGIGTTIHVIGSNCIAKSLVAGSNVQITNSSTIITISASGWQNNTASNLGSVSSLSEGVFASKVGVDLQFKRLLEGSNIALSSNTTHITIAVTGITSESTTCTNVGTGNKILKTTATSCTANSLIAGTGITITNSTDDYTFATITNASSGFIPKPTVSKHGTVIPATPSGDLGGLFFGSTLGGTESLNDDADGVRILTTTGTTAGTDAGISTGSAIFHREWNAYLTVKIGTSSTAGERLFIGFITTSTLPNTQTPCANISCAGIFLNTTSTTYQYVVNDGDATQDITNSGISENSDVRIFTVRADATNNRFAFSINNGVETFISSEIPASTTDMFCVIALETSDASSDSLRYYYAYVQEDK